jgi:peptidoglycan/xylan/chitin deacetylase (PgdA/CDA1 family)
LLYHHVSDNGDGNRYYVSVATFRAQMKALHDWGYTAITVHDLVEVLTNGGELPSRPVVITFDDGNLDIYQNAFPIMHELGFVGTAYIVASRLQWPAFLNVEQIQEMADDGWEIGSHSMTHSDLTTDYSNVDFEMGNWADSNMPGEPISIAHPCGKTDDL